MADNINVTPGSGAIVAADDIQVSGSHAQGLVQFVKLVDGTLNGTAPIVVDIGAKANALRICPANDITDGTYIGDIKFGEALIAGTNLIGKVGIDQTTPGTTNRVDIGALIPGTGATNLGKVEDVGHSSGDVGVMTLTVRQNTAAALGTTDADYQPLITDANGRLHVLDANSADILTALQLIDNAVDGNYLNCNLNFAGTDAQIGEGIISASTLRVTIATDDDSVAHLATIAGDTTSINGKITVCNTGAVVLATGSAAIGTLAANSGVDIGDVTINNASGASAVNIQDGGNTITVDGTITADAGTNLNTSALALESGGNLATIAGDTTAIQAAVEIMDDWDATQGSAVSSDGIQLMGAYDSTKPSAVSDGQSARVLVDSYGRLLPGVEPEWFNAVFDSVNATAEGQVVKAATASKKIYVTSYIISSDVEGWIKLQDEDSNALTGKFWLKAGGGVSWTAPVNAPLILNVVNKALEVICEAAGDVSVSMTGYLAV